MSLSRPEINQYDKDQSCYDTGLSAEERFAELARSKGLVVVKADDYQNMKEHIDFILYGDNFEITVDVKAKKKVGRSDKLSQDKFAWIELKGVYQLGWIDGKADYICFERDKGFWFIKRERLKERVMQLVKQEFVVSPEMALYKLYRRKGRRDILTLIEFAKIADIVARKWRFEDVKTN